MGVYCTISLGRRAGAGVVAMAAILGPAPARALQSAPVDTVGIQGRVTDAQTGGPVAMALVHVRTTDQRAVTDAAGAFIFRGLEAGTYLFEVSRLGYETYEFELGVRPGMPLLIELHPQPVILEGLRVAVDRFAERTRRIPYDVYSWDEATLASARHAEVAWFLGDKPWLQCGGSRPGCNTLVAARERPIIVFIDEMLRDWDVLATYRTDQLYRIEFVRNCPMVRVYTKAFMERIAAGRARLPDSFVADCLWVRRRLGLRLF